MGPTQCRSLNVRIGRISAGAVVEFLRLRDVVSNNGSYVELTLSGGVERCVFAVVDGAPAVEAGVEAIHSSCFEMSCAVCQRSAGSLARQVRTMLSSAGGVMVCSAVIGCGSVFMIAAIRLA